MVVSTNPLSPALQRSGRRVSNQPHLAYLATQISNRDTVVTVAGRPVGFMVGHQQLLELSIESHDLGLHNRGGYIERFGYRSASRAEDKPRGKVARAQPLMTIRADDWETEKTQRPILPVLEARST
jgi:hypothetical protein